MLKIFTVFASIAVLGMSGSAMATDTSIQPLPLQDCETTAKAISKAIGIRLTTATGPAPSYPEGLRGQACLMSGKASGLTIAFERAQDKIAAALAGWQHLTEFDADGPDSTAKGFAKGQQRLFYTLSMEPPPGTCNDDKPSGDCKIPQRRWIWDLKAAAFIQ